MDSESWRKRALSAHFHTFNLYRILYCIVLQRGTVDRVPSHQIVGIQSRKKDFGQKRKWGINESRSMLDGRWEEGGRNNMRDNGE